MRVIKYRNYVSAFSKCLIIIVVFLGVGAVGYWLWNRGTFLPQWIVWEHGTFQDASGQYQITLTGKTVRVSYKDTMIWTTEKDVKVQKALSADIDRDGQDELILLCWRKGHYGDVKPIWVEEDEDDWVQHIFVYECLEGDVKAKWMSSYIGKDILDVTIKETGNIGCFLCLTDSDGEETLWMWDSWGFTKVNIPLSKFVDTSY